MARFLTRWKGEWRRFSGQPPGRRFVDRYERRHEHRTARSWWRRLLSILGGILLLLVGAFFAVAPGPAVIFFALGGLLIARESRIAARFLDWIDRLLAPVLRWIAHRWRALSPLARRVTALCMVVWTVGGLIAGFVVMR